MQQNVIYSKAKKYGHFPQSEGYIQQSFYLQIMANQTANTMNWLLLITFFIYIY